MGTISTRVPDELEAELEAYLEDEKLDRSTAVRKLLSEGLEEWRTKHEIRGPLVDQVLLDFVWIRFGDRTRNHQ